jgi:hypothetical protein
MLSTTKNKKVKMKSRFLSGKRFLYTLALIAATCLISRGATLTVSNDPVGGAQYSNLFAAYNAAVSGQDTLLVEGTNIPYTFTNPNCGPWAKNLVIIGVGFNPQKQNPRHTQLGCIDVCNGDTKIANAASGSRFYGIEFTCDIQLVATVNNLVFEDCRFNNGFNFNGNAGSNYIWKNCLFITQNSQNIRFGNGSSNSNMLVTNCIFNGYLSNDNPTSNLSLTVDHCIFLNTTGSFTNIINALIKNSIFMNTATIEFNNSGNNTYLNNISRLGSFPSGVGSGGNQSNTNPNFVTYTLGAFYSSSHDYHLQSGSAAIGAASDATDTGVHGGTSNFNEQGEVLITPIMRSVNINNTTIAPNGILNVQIHATKPDDN